MIENRNNKIKINNIILEREPNTFCNWFEELLISDSDKPADVTFRRHQSVWYDSIPIKFRKTKRNLIITFDLQDRIYINIKWNIEEYLNKSVHKNYHELVKSLMKID